VFTSANIATFLTGNRCGTYVITTTAAGSPGPTRITMTGALPIGLTFVDNGDGTATISGCPNGVTGTKSFSLTLTATNSVGSATQRYSLVVEAPSTIPLPKKLPASSGVLGGVPQQTTRNQVLHLTGSGYAPGAPITIGYYAGPVTVTTAFASSTGTFAVDITVTALGSHTFVASGIGSDGKSRFLEATSNTTS
jgi:hypothetical protein